MNDLIMQELLKSDDERILGKYGTSIFPWPICTTQQMIDKVISEWANREFERKVK